MHYLLLQHKQIIQQVHQIIHNKYNKFMDQQYNIVFKQYNKYAI